MVAINKQIEFFNTISKDCEMKQKMKDKFYEIKIQEAKDKKGLTKFNWEELPSEIEEMIMGFKYVIEISGEKWNKKGYIVDAIKEHHLTMKSFKDFIFKEYKNENGDGLSQVPCINYNFERFIYAMINKKSIWDEVFGQTTHTKRMKDIRLEKDYEAITKNKTPSLEEFIKFRKNEKESQKEARSEKAKKTSEENLEKVNKFNVGELIYYRCDCDNHPIAYVITGETKTQYRVDKVEWSQEFEFNNGYISRRWFCLDKNKNVWKKEKVKNLSKKFSICKFGQHDLWHRDNAVEDNINIVDYYVTRTCFSMMD